MNRAGVGIALQHGAGEDCNRFFLQRVVWRGGRSNAEVEQEREHLEGSVTLCGDRDEPSAQQEGTVKSWWHSQLSGENRAVAG